MALSREPQELPEEDWALLERAMRSFRKRRQSRQDPAADDLSDAEDEEGLGYD